MTWHIFPQKLGFFRNSGPTLELAALTNHPKWLNCIKGEFLPSRQWDGVRYWARFFLNGCAIRVVGEEQIVESEAALNNRKSLQVRDGVSKECWKIHYLRISRWKLGSMFFLGGRGWCLSSHEDVLFEVFMLHVVLPKRAVLQDPQVSVADVLAFLHSVREGGNQCLKGAGAGGILKNPWS